VAALDGADVLAQRELPPDVQSARSLVPGIKAVLDEVGWQPEGVQLVAVTSGPGSFTGLRVGVATAKTFAYAAGTEVLGVGTLEAIAERIDGEPNASLRVAIDAQRQKVFSARFVWQGELWQRQGDIVIADNAAWLASLQPGELVSGTALRKLADQVPPQARIANQAFWHPTAQSVGSLAFRDYQQGRRDDPWQLLPAYHRRSAAEEKLGS